MFLITKVALLYGKSTTDVYPAAESPELLIQLLQRALLWCWYPTTS